MKANPNHDYGCRWWHCTVCNPRKTRQASRLEDCGCRPCQQEQLINHKQTIE